MPNTRAGVLLSEVSPGISEAPMHPRPGVQGRKGEERGGARKRGGWSIWKAHRKFDPEGEAVFSLVLLHA